MPLSPGAKLGPYEILAPIGAGGAGRAKTDEGRVNSMKFVVGISRDEDGVFIAQCPSIPGCVSQGRTEEEAELNIVDAIRECLAVRADLGLPRAVALREVEVPI